MHDSSVSTAHLADACRQLGVAVRCGPPSLRPAIEVIRFVGPAVPVKHTGSVDVILQAIDRLPVGAVLVVDDQARTDRACIGDLITLEAKLAGAAAIVVNGLHRDTDELIELGLPVFSLGSSPSGPLEWTASPADALDRCRLGPWEITSADVIVGDRDGIIVLPADRVDELRVAAETIRDREHRQARLARDGTSLRQQFDLAGYLVNRATNPQLSFREHLSDRGASVEV